MCHISRYRSKFSGWFYITNNRYCSDGNLSCWSMMHIQFVVSCSKKKKRKKSIHLPFLLLKEARVFALDEKWMLSSVKSSINTDLWGQLLLSSLCHDPPSFFRTWVSCFMVISHLLFFVFFSWHLWVEVRLFFRNTSGRATAILV